jgi:23S rRNA (guanosine2251-2'-O)-methyltransferase
MIKLNAKQLRVSRKSRGSRMSRRNEIYIVLDNVLDTYNIGSIFRLADAVGAKKVYLCGGTEIPPNHRIKKASINTTEWVEWEYGESAERVIRGIKGERGDIQVVAIEQAEGSVAYDQFEYKLPIALVVGHESEGVSKEVLEICDGVVELPMFGVNISLNVMVSLGIVLYEVVEKVGLAS